MPVEFPPWLPPAPPDTTTPDLQNARSVLAAADGSSIPVIYGRAAAPASIFVLTVSTITDGGLNLNPGDLVMGLAWCIGEISDINNVYVGDAVIDPAWLRANYLGTQTQGIDPVLAAVIPGYADTLRGTVYGHSIAIAYSVIVVPSGSDFPANIQAEIDGRLTLDVNDPGGPKLYQAGAPAPSIADFLTDPLIGLGAEVDYPSFVELDNYCTGKWGMNLAIIERAPIDQWIQTLREYANCWFVLENGKVYAVPRDVVPDIDLFRELIDDDIVEGSVSLQQIGSLDLPTVVAVEAFKLATWPFKQDIRKQEHPGIATEEVEHRETLLSFTGAMGDPQMDRRAIQRLNRYNLTHLRMTCTVFDEGIFYRIGDVFKVRHSYGVLGKRMRLVEMTMTTIGRWEFVLEEYDPRALDFDTIHTDPTWTDTDLLPHDQPPLPTNVATSIAVIEGRRYVLITWDFDDSQYIYPYYFKVTYQGTSQVDGSGINDTEYTNQGATELYILADMPAPASGTARVGTVSDWMGRNVETAQVLQPWNFPGDPQSPVPAPTSIQANWHIQPHQAIISWEWNRPDTWEWPLDGFRISGTREEIDIATDNVLATTPFTIDLAPENRAWISGSVGAGTRINLTASVTALSGAEESSSLQTSISSDLEEWQLPSPQNLAVDVHVNPSNTTPPGIFHVRFSPTYTVSTLGYPHPFDGAGKLTLIPQYGQPIVYDLYYPSQILQSRPPPTYEMDRPVMWARSTESGNIWDSFGPELEVPTFGVGVMEYTVEVWCEAGPLGNRYQGPKAIFQGLLFGAPVS